MVVSFSSAYFLDQMYVELYPGPQALLNREHLEDLNEEVYVEDHMDVYTVGHPLIIRLEKAHQIVYGSDNVPYGTLLLPRARIECQMAFPCARGILIAKKDRVEQLAKLFQ